MSNEYLDIAINKVIRQEVNKVLADVRAEIDDIDITEYLTSGFRQFKLPRQIVNEVLAIIDKHRQTHER